MTNRVKGTHLFYTKDEFLKELRKLVSHARGNRIVGVERDKDDYYGNDLPFAAQFLLTKDEFDKIFVNCDKPCCVTEDK